MPRLPGGRSSTASTGRLTRANRWRRALPPPLVGAGPGWGVAPNSDRAVLYARPQFRQSHKDRPEHAVAQAASMSSALLDPPPLGSTRPHIGGRGSAWFDPANDPREPDRHNGGTSPSFPTSTNPASTEPSSCFAPRAMIAAPSLRSLLAPGSKPTIGVFGSTTMVCWPPL